MYKRQAEGRNGAINVKVTFTDDAHVAVFVDSGRGPVSYTHLHFLVGRSAFFVFVLMRSEL